MRARTHVALIAVTLATATAGAAPYRGPARPAVPADAGPIRTTLAQCTADVKDAIDLDGSELAKAAHHLCDLRAQHAAARAELLGKLAHLVTEFRDVTNHDHAENLPSTIRGIQQLVAGCLTTLDSQQYPHNIAIPLVAEHDAIFCDRQASAVVDQIDAPYDTAGL